MIPVQFWFGYYRFPSGNLQISFVWREQDFWNWWFWNFFTVFQLKRSTHRELQWNPIASFAIGILKSWTAIKSAVFFSLNNKIKFWKMHWLQVFATRFLIFNFLWNHKPEVSRARESRTHDSGHEHHVTNPKSSKYLQQKLRPIQLAEFGFIVWKIVLSIFTFKNLHYRCRCAYKNASFCSKNSAYLSLLNRI